MGKKNRIFKCAASLGIAFVMAATLIVPLGGGQAEAASNQPSFSRKPAVTAKLIPVRKKVYNKVRRMNLRLEANQKIGRFDTIQGSCYGKGYIYYTMWDRVRVRTKIVKMRKSDLRVVRTSPVLDLTHAGDMTYNTRTNRIIVAHGRPKAKDISIINPDTLTVEKRITVELPKGFPADSKSSRKRISKKGYKGFNSIAYNASHRVYVVQLYGMRDFVYLNENFVPVKFVRLDRFDSQMYQGIESFGNYIIVCNSFKPGKPYNILSLYNWKGDYISRIKLNRGMELESVFRAGNRLYACYYKSYVARYQWTLKKKKVRKSLLSKKKITVTYYGKKRKLGKRFLNRDGYIYLLTNL